MRVVMVILEYWPITGGAQRQIAAVAPGLGRAGAEVHVVTRRAPGLAAEERHEGVVVHRLPAPGPKAVASLVFTVAALRRLRALRPDVVHAYSLFSPLTIGLLARRWLGVPLVVKVLRGGRGGDVERLRRKTLSRVRIGALRREVDRVLSISSEIDAELDALGVDRSRRLALPNGVDVERFRPAAPGERASLRASLGLPAGPVAIYAGRLVEEKRVDLLLEAWASVRDRHPEATLVVAGAGPCEPALRRAAGEGVRLLGGVDDVAPWLRAADVFVLPSDAEGLSNALLEAMATGLLVIATRVGGAGDVIEDGRDGVLLEPGDVAGLRDALTHWLDPARADERAALGRAARAVVCERLSLASVASRLSALYAELCEPVRRPVAVGAPVAGRPGGKELPR